MRNEKFFLRKEGCLVVLLLLFGVYSPLTASTVSLKRAGKTNETIQQQQAKVPISGIVIDENGQPITAATVTLKGASGGVITDVDGKFTINASPTDVLEITYLGYQTFTQVIGDERKFNVRMQPKSNELEGITVVAFGKQKKESVVASIETVNVKDLRIPGSNLTTSFAGRIPGLISYSDTGEPGADNAHFFVRGVSTFGMKVDPLILIDGFESSTDDLARIQTDDIETFSILKDATATSLYGPRGANGIIMVTTKGGKEGPLRISMRIDAHVATPTRILELISAEEYMRLYNQARVSRNPELGPYYSEQKIQSTVNKVDPLVYPDINWYDVLFNRQTINTKANLNISGGSQIATYHVSGGYEYESGLLKVDRKNNFNSNISINRFNLRSNVIFNFGKTTKLDTRISGRVQRYTGPYNDAGTIYSGILNSNPVDFPPVYAPDEAHQYADYILFGSVIPAGSQSPKSNPYAEMVRGYKGRDEASFTAQVSLLQDLDFITENLKAQARLSFNMDAHNEASRLYEPLYFGIDQYDPMTGVYKLLRLNPTAQYPRLGNIRSSRNSTNHTYAELRFNWNRTFDKHSFGLMTVGTLEESTDSNGAESIFEALPQRNLGNSGRATYDFDTRYFLEFTYGYNGSEKFTGKKRYGFFPSFAAGWLLSNESFWEPLANLVNTFKLKASYGLVGNDAIASRGNRFWFLSWITQDDVSGTTWGENFSTHYRGYEIRRYANPDITWELAKKYNYGVETAFLKGGSLKINAEFFRDYRSQVYMQRNSLPETLGLEAGISGNIGRINSHGFDGSIDFQHSFNKDVWVEARANYTFSKNKIVECDEENFQDKYLSKIGQSANQIQGYVAERLFVDEAEIANSPEQTFGRYQAGDIKYTDVNGDGVVNSNDRVWMGYPSVPEIQYGFGLSMGYRNFDFNFFFQGNAHVSFMINPRADGIAPFINQRNALAIVARGAWTETNPDVHAFWPRLSTNELNNNTQSSSWWLRDGSLLRMKDAEIGYNLPWTKKLNIQNVRVYFTCSNVFRLSAFKMWDPEMGGNGMGYPLNRRFNLGLNVNF